MKNFKALLIDKSVVVKDAMRQLDKTAKKIVFIVDENQKLIGSLTDGDIRRWILKDGSLQAAVEEVCFKDTYFVRMPYDLEVVKKEMIERDIKYIPVVDKGKKIKEFIIWDEIFGKIKKKIENKLDVNVVIMAGGKGTRLDPFTKILPKPLIPVGDKTILEHIINRFLEFNVSHFYISINHKAKIIKSYFEELNPEYSITFITEDKPLGTIGSIKQLEGKVNKEIILTNCDIIIESDYLDILSYHKESKNDITILSLLKHYKIPYGVCKVKNGLLLSIEEKPEYDLLVNTGMYVINPKLLGLIPENTKFDATNFIDMVKNKGYKVGIYPISDNAWIDVGEWHEYKKAVERLSL